MLRELKCVKCGEEDPNKFYGHKKSYCGACHNAWTKENATQKRLKAVNHLGGKCSECGYNKYTCGLDIHHIDPSIKDSQFNNMRYWSWKRIEKEIVGCVLLCKCCHAAVHAGLVVLKNF